MCAPGTAPSAEDTKKGKANFCLQGAHSLLRKTTKQICTNKYSHAKQGNLREQALRLPKICNGFLQKVGTVAKT